MPDVALDLITAASSSPLLGEYAFRDSVSSSGNTSTIFSDAGLRTYTTDNRYQNYWMFRPYAAYTLRERFIFSRSGALGQLQYLEPTDPINSERYLLFRDFSWSEWLDLLNDTMRSLFFTKETYLQGITDIVRYSLPVPISRGEQVRDVFLVPYPFRWTNELGKQLQIRFYRLDPLNIQGDLYLVLEAATDASHQLLFLHDVPYAHPHMSAFTMTRSVLTPFGETASISAPRNLITSGLVWRALRRKVQNLSGQSRAVWERNLEVAARQYAEQIAAHGVRAVGVKIGYAMPW